MKKIEGIQELRGIGFIFVFLSHVSNLSSLGWFANELFFLISGFCLYLKYENTECNNSIKSSICFGINKIRKIYPHYIFTILLVLPLYAKEHNLYKIVFDFIFNVFLLQALIPFSTSINGPTWFLSSIFIVYIFSKSIIKRVKKIDNNILEIIKIIVIQLSMFYILRNIQGFAINLSQITNNKIGWFSVCDSVITWITFSNPLFRLWDFEVGCLLAKQYKMCDNKNVVHNSYVYTIICITSVILLNNISNNPSNDWFRYKLVFIPFAIMLVYCFLYKSNKYPILEQIGNIGDIAFVYHSVIIQYVSLFFINRTLVLVLSFLLTIVVSYIIKNIHNKQYEKNINK